MTLIKCPNCGKTVLSVASVCPGCAVPLTRERPPHTWAGTLTECRRCGHPVTTEASVCPHCAIRKPGQYVVSPVVLAVLAVVLISTVMVAVVAPRLALLGERTPSAPAIRAGPPLPKRVAAAVSRESTVVAPNPVAPAAAPQPTDSVAPNVSVTANDSAASKDSVSAQVSVAATDTVVPNETVVEKDTTPVPTRYTRWVTSMWVNVREGPADNTPVVAVLRPGQRVEAGTPTRDGWQMVYVDGRRLGYVARSLLTSLPPSR